MMKYGAILLIKLVKVFFNQLSKHLLVQTFRFWQQPPVNNLPSTVYQTQFVYQSKHFFHYISIIPENEISSDKSFTHIWPYKLANKWEIILLLLRKLAVVESKLWKKSMQNLFLYHVKYNLTTANFLKRSNIISHLFASW